MGLARMPTPVVRTPAMAGSKVQGEVTGTGDSQEPEQQKPAPL